MVRLNFPLRQNYSIFMAIFQKNQDKISNNLVNLPNRTPFVNLNPYQEILDPSLLIFFVLFHHSVFTWVSLYGILVEPGCTPHMGAYISPIWVSYRLLAGKQLVCLN